MHRDQPVPASDLPPSCYDEEGSEADRDPRYCPECVREAARWNAESSNLVFTRSESAG